MQNSCFDIGLLLVKLVRDMETSQLGHLQPQILPFAGDAGWKGQLRGELAPSASTSPNMILLQRFRLGCGCRLDVPNEERG